MGGFRVGDKVKVREGKLEGQIGTIKEMARRSATFEMTCLIDIKSAPNGVAIIAEHCLELYDENTGKTIKRNKFEVGNKVTVSGGNYQCSEGFIVEVRPADDYWYYVCDDLYEQIYLVKLKGNQIVRIEEQDLARDTSPIGLFEEMVYAGKYEDVGEPVFNTGDVVEVIAPNSSQNRICVVREPVLMELYEAVKYVYRVSPIDSCDEVYTYDGSSLEFQYHDATWQQYFEESIQNALPAWRGESYNLDMLYVYSYFCVNFNRKSREEYNNDTIHPLYMKHILKDHTISGRIDVVLSCRDSVKVIKEKLQVNDNDLYRLERLIEDKIYARNMSDSDPKSNGRISDKAGFKFTESELSLISEINNLYISNEEFIDCFPVEMTTPQIMRAIKEAYYTARRISEVKLQRVYDRRTEMFSWSDCEIIEPVKGKALYEGISQNGLVICFWYNFDLNLIEDAYPVIEKNYDKKKRTVKGGN